MFKRGIKLPFGADEKPGDTEEPDGTESKGETKPDKPLKRQRNRKNAQAAQPDEEEEGDADGNLKADTFKGNLDLEQLLADARTAVNKDAK